MEREITDLGESSSGLDPKVAALLCYLVGWISGIVFWVIEKKSPFVLFHAKQSVFTFLGLSVFGVVAGWIPVIGGVVSFLLIPVALILWIVLMMKAYAGEWFKLPVVGDWAEEPGDRPGE